jgi:glycosyltransferase involved in cell wall biosynthesis
MDKGVVVTPYANEPMEMILRCIESVAAQTVPVRHLLVADGNPRKQLEFCQGVEHATLEKRYNDWGNTPRAYGMIHTSKAPFIALLDVDNIYLPEHIESCLATAKANPDCDFVASKRQFVRYDKGAYTPSSAVDEPQWKHIDTSCYFFLPGTYALAAYMWANGPQECARYRYSVDRHVYGALRAAGKKPAFTNRETVIYTVHGEPAEKRHAPQ